METTPPPREKEEWLTLQRARVLTLANDCNLKPFTIHKITKIPESIVQDILKSGSARRPGRDRPGRPPALNDQQVDDVISYLDHNFQHRIMPWMTLGNQGGLDVHPCTLRRALANRGHYKCIACPKPFSSPSAREKRWAFVMDHVHRTWQWEEVLWSDESTFYIGKQRKAIVIHTRKERYCSYTCQNRYRSGRTSFPIWAAVGWNYKSPIVFLSGLGAKGGLSKYMVKKAKW